METKWQDTLRKRLCPAKPLIKYGEKVVKKSLEIVRHDTYHM